MKKLIVAAMMVLGTTSAFAGDSDALKAVLKAKTYAEAEALVKQNLGQLAGDAEKAKAYNKLVDLSMKAFNDQQSIQQTNQIMKKNDVIASVCKVMSSELEASVEEESRSAWAKKSEEIENDTVGAKTAEEAAEAEAELENQDDENVQE